MTLDQLRYFVAAAKHEHIHRAARSIPISASVISNAVRELEEEYGCELFTREKKRIRLSPSGMRLLEVSINLLSSADGVRQQLGQANAPLSGHYRIGASNFLAPKVLSPAWSELQKKYPRLTADVCSQPTWTLVGNILAGKMDFGVGFSPTPHPQLETEVLHRGKAAIVVRKNHPIFSRRKKNHYMLLGEYPLCAHVADERITSPIPHPALKGAGIECPITFSFDNEYVALENIRNSDNWAVIVDIAARELSKHLQIVPFPGVGELDYAIHFIRHKSRHLTPVMSETIALLKIHLGRLTPRKKR